MLYLCGHSTSKTCLLFVDVPSGETSQKLVFLVWEISGVIFLSERPQKNLPQSILRCFLALNQTEGQLSTRMQVSHKKVGTYLMPPCE